MNREDLLTQFSEPIPVGPHGFVRLVDTMGNDAAVCQAARISYGAGTKSVSEDRGLIRYLMRSKHTSPFEQCEIKLHVRVPMDTWRQWIRHRTASVNEYSTRYSEAIDDMATTAPDAWRLQTTDNKQGSSGTLTEWPDGNARYDAHGYLRYASPGEYFSDTERQLHAGARAVYRERRKLGIAREQARKDLPLSTYTEAYWKIDLHNLLHFLRLRLDSHAQLEIRQFAEAIASIVKVWVPDTWEAFGDYALHAHTFSRQELEILREFVRLGVNQVQVGTALNREVDVTPRDVWKAAFSTFAPDLTQRERKAFLAALGRLDGLDG